MASVFLFRKVYQNPLFEIGLFISLLAHMTSNTMIYLHRQKIEQKASAAKKDDDAKAKVEPPGYYELKGHRYTGYFLSFAVIGHIFATRILPVFALDDPTQYDYTFLTHAQALFGPVFGVYLMLFGIAGGWHLIYGTRSAITTLFLGSSVTGKPFPLALKPVALLNHVLIINAVLAVCFGVYYAVDMDTKDDLYKRVYSFYPI